MWRAEWNIFHRCALRILLYCAHLVECLVEMSTPIFLSLCMQYSWDLTSHLLQSRMRQAGPNHMLTSLLQQLQSPARGCRSQPVPVRLGGNGLPVAHSSTSPLQDGGPHSPPSPPPLLPPPASVFVHALMRWYEQFHSAEFLSGCQSEN